MSKINRSQLPPATSQWLSYNLRGRQAKTCFRCVKSTPASHKAPKGSPSLFSFYIADILIPTEPVKRVCYADDLTVWATGVNIPDMEDSLNSHLKEITAYLKDNSQLISSPVISNIVHPGHTPSQDPPENTHQGLTATSATMSKDFGSPPGHLTIIQ